MKRNINDQNLARVISSIRGSGHLHKVRLQLIFASQWFKPLASEDAANYNEWQIKTIISYLRELSRGVGGLGWGCWDPLPRKIQISLKNLHSKITERTGTYKALYIPPPPPTHTWSNKKELAQMLIK